MDEINNRKTKSGRRVASSFPTTREHVPFAERDPKEFPKWEEWAGQYIDQFEDLNIVQLEDLARDGGYKLRNRFKELIISELREVIRLRLGE